MKKLLIVVSVYRQGERIHPIIPSLSNDFDLSLLSVHQMNYRQQWNGSIDMRDEFHKRYDSYFEHIHNDLTKVDYSKYDAILFDDCRDKGHEIPTMIIYSIAKQNNIKVFANQHGNRDFTNKSFEINHYKKFLIIVFYLVNFKKINFLNL